MKNIITALCLCLFFGAYAQKENLDPCGTKSIRSAWLKNYQKDPSKFDKRGSETIWVPMSVTIVGFDNGSGYISEKSVIESLCTLNDDYSDADIQFYLGAPIRYLNNSKYADHQTVLEGAEMMFENNIPNMINNYIMTNAAGNCGYNLPYAGIALSINCTQPTDHTWAHEVGHNLSLPHPFLGWEGGVSHDGSISHNFNDPAPQRVLYDYTYFQDTLILDTMIIDTAWVEKVDGSNCMFAADGFCDTPPDYLAQRWSCAGGMSIEQTDPNGEKFRSDESLIMSYAFDNCSDRFSNEQIAAMRANLIDEKSSYLGNDNFIDSPSEVEVAVLAPEDDEEVYFEDVYIEWEEVQNAPGYFIQVTRFSNFQVVVFDTIVAEPNVTFTADNFPTAKHYFRIKPYNDYNFCTDWVAYGNFQATNVQTSIEEKLLRTISLKPSMIAAGKSFIVENEQKVDFRMSVSNVGGNVVHSESMNRKINTVSTDSWDAGVYFVSYIIGEAVVTERLVVVN